MLVPAMLPGWIGASAGRLGVLLWRIPRDHGRATVSVKFPDLDLHQPAASASIFDRTVFQFLPVNLSAKALT